MRTKTSYFSQKFPFFFELNNNGRKRLSNNCLRLLLRYQGGSLIDPFECTFKDDIIELRIVTEIKFVLHSFPSVYESIDEVLCQFFR